MKYNVIHDGKDRESWLAARQNTLGASEAPGVCGVGRYSSPMKVFVDKTEGPEPFDSPITRFGRIFERQIAEDFAQATKRRVVLDGRMIASRRRPWQSCTLDARQYKDDRPDPGLVEIKTDLYGWGDGEIPIAYYTQVMHQFAVTGFKWGSVVMFNRTNCELVYRDLEPDPEFIRQMTLRESVFWHQHVLPGIPPSVEDEDATEATRLALLRLYPQHEVGETMTFTTKEMRARDKRAFAKENLARYTKMKDAAENVLKAAIGSAESGVFPDGSGFTFKVDKRGIRTLREKERI